MATGGSTFGIVKSPPAEPPEVGLIQSLSGPYLDPPDGEIDGHPERWYGGFQYNPEQQCYTMRAFDPCNVVGLVTPPNPDLVKAMPFGIAAGDRCSTFGWSARDYKGRAQRALLASESKQIAHELWEGKQTQASGWPNPYLASSSAQILSSGAKSAGDALAIIEQGIADSSNGARGMVHCSRQVGAALSELGNTFRNVGGLILTYMGSIIVPDAGYPGTSPSGQIPATSQWMYGTQMVTVRRSPITVYPDSFAEAIVPGTNLLEFRAERLAAAAFPPCTLVACEVSIPPPVGGMS